MAKISTRQTGLADPDDDHEHPLDLHGLGHTLLRRSWLILLAAALAGSGVWAATRTLPPAYRSTAVIEIATQLQQAIDLRDDSPTNLQNPEVVETIIEKFESRSLLDRVNKVLKLSTDARFLGFIPSRPASDELVDALLLGGVKATLRPRTRLVDISFTHADRTVASRVVNTLVDEFLNQSAEQRSEMLEAQNRVLAVKSQELKEKVNRSELDLQKYKQDVASVSLEDRRNLLEEKLKGLNGDLTNAKGECLRLESDADQAKRARGSTDQLLAIPSVALDSQVVAARDRLTKEEENMTALSQRYGQLHPRMIEEKADLEAARSTVAEAVRTAPDRIGNRFLAASSRLEGLQRAVQEQEASLLEMDAKVIPFRALQREYDSNRALFESVLQRLKESTLQLGVQSVEFQVVESAGSARLQPNRRLLYTAAGAVAGGGLAGAILLLVFLLRQSVSTVEAAERLLRLPVLTTIPRMRGAGPAGTVAAMQRPESQEAESFRTLRTALQMLAGDTAQVILFTSAIPAEGKSVSAGNTAVAFAQLGLRTLLIDADLRRPSLDALFAPAAGGELTGLGDYLNGKPVNIVPTKQTNLAFLAAGSLLAEPAELLAGPQFDQLIQRVKPDYDRIVIDTAPVNVVSDTLNIVSSASVVCLVVRSNSTPVSFVKRAVELLKRSGVQPDGIILNWTSAWRQRRYQEYYQGSGAYGAKAGGRAATVPVPASSAART